MALRDFTPPHVVEASSPEPGERRRDRPAAARGARGLGQQLREALPRGAAAPARQPGQRRGARRQRRPDLFLSAALEARPAHARGRDSRHRRTADVSTAPVVRDEPAAPEPSPRTAPTRAASPAAERAARADPARDPGRLRHRRRCWRPATSTPASRPATSTAAASAPRSWASRSSRSSAGAAARPTRSPRTTSPRPRRRRPRSCRSCSAPAGRCRR